MVRVYFLLVILGWLAAGASGETPLRIVVVKDSVRSEARSLVEAVIAFRNAGGFRGRRGLDPRVGSLDFRTQEAALLKPGFRRGGTPYLALVRATASPSVVWSTGVKDNRAAVQALARQLGQGMPVEYQVVIVRDKGAPVPNALLLGLKHKGRQLASFPGVSGEPALTDAAWLRRTKVDFSDHGDASGHVFLVVMKLKKPDRIGEWAYQVWGTYGDNADQAMGNLWDFLTRLKNEKGS